MQLLVIGHAIAMDREEFAESGESDDRRPLTSRGTKRMRKVARGLRQVVDRIDVLATSPYTRAVETAAIVSDEFGIGPAEVSASLVPDVHFNEFEEWARAYSNTNLLAIAGHEPHLTGLVTWLMTGNGDSRLELRKGGACLIDFDANIRRGSGTLLWLLTPGQLRSLAG